VRTQVDGKHTNRELESPSWPEVASKEAWGDLLEDRLGSMSGFADDPFGHCSNSGVDSDWAQRRFHERFFL
jgi:hypothetical protein